MKTVKPLLSDHIKQDMFLAFQTDLCLLLIPAKLSALLLFHAAISNHLSIAISMSPEWMVA